MDKHQVANYFNYFWQLPKSWKGQFNAGEIKSFSLIPQGLAVTTQTGKFYVLSMQKWQEFLDESFNSAKS